MIKTELRDGQAVGIRDYDYEIDHAFIMATGLRSLRVICGRGLNAETAAFYHDARPAMEWIIQNSHVKVAVDVEHERTIYGWAAYTPNGQRLYGYTVYSLRGIGIQRALSSANCNQGSRGSSSKVA